MNHEFKTRSMLQDDIAIDHIIHMEEMKRDMPVHGLWLDPLILRLKREIEDRLQLRKLVTDIQPYPRWIINTVFIVSAFLPSFLLYLWLF